MSSIAGAATVVSVQRDRVRLVPGLLRGRPVGAPPGTHRIGLIGTTALLLGGDEVVLRVEVGRGARLELFDVAGTVAYHGRGRSCGWQVEVELAEDAELVWAAEPFVVSDGADVDRRLLLQLADGASAELRDSLVLGRGGQIGGVIRSRTTVLRDGSPVLLEDQAFGPDRGLPGVLGGSRVVDTLLGLGRPAPDPVPGAVRLDLAGGHDWLVRYVGRELAASPLRPPTLARR